MVIEHEITHLEKVAAYIKKQIEQIEGKIKALEHYKDKNMEHYDRQIERFEKHVKFLKAQKDRFKKHMNHKIKQWEHLKAVREARLK